MVYDGKKKKRFSVLRSLPYFCSPHLTMPPNLANVWDALDTGLDLAVVPSPQILLSVVGPWYDAFSKRTDFLSPKLAFLRTLEVRRAQKKGID